MLYCHQNFEYFISGRNFEHYFSGDSQPGVCEQNVGILKILNYTQGDLGTLNQGRRKQKTLQFLKKEII
jgi:hypothetical protein